MRSVIGSISLIYLVIVSCLLSFLAIWVCDGYYPVGWDVRGALIHIGMWSPPVMLLAGCVMLGKQVWRRTAIAFLWIPLAYFASIMLWALIAPPHQHNYWVFYVWLAAPLVAGGAAKSFSDWTQPSTPSQRNQCGVVANKSIEL
jgi:hypothetical protein